jgi:hypothetical protein
MSKKHFSLLAVLTAVVVAIAFLLPGETARESGFEQEALLPDLEGQVNDIDWLRISAGGAVLATAVRREGQWQIEESAGYAADWPQIQQLLSGLSSAMVLEAKTANPEYYGRLGVEDPGSSDGSGVLVEFAEVTGLPAVIVGNAAKGRDGQYLRLADSAQSVLVDVELEVPRTAEDWLEREVTDIADSEVVEVEITAADGESVLASKVAADDADFTLQDVPEGFEPNSNWAVNSLAGGLSSLRLEAVAPASNFDWAEAVRYRVLTADGLIVEAELVALAQAGDEGEEHWLRIEAGTRTTAVEDGMDEEAAAATAERAAAINARASGWAYRVPQYKFESMSKRMEDLVRETEATE